MRARMLLALFMGLTAFALVFSSARAQTSCDELVVDEAGVFQAQLSRVETAAKNLFEAGADVRVRTFKTFAPAANLDQFEEQVEGQCPSWGSAGGGRKNNLVVLMIALKEQKTGLYYGSEWEGTLGAQWVRIQTDFMNPRFKEGDFVGGFARGLGEVGRLIERQVEASGKARQPASPGGAVDLSGLWRVLLWVLAAAVSLVGAVFVYRLISGYQRERGRRRAARQKALLAKQAAASRISELPEKLQMLQIKVEAMVGTVSEEDARPLRDGLAQAKGLADSAARTYSDLGHSAGDPDRPNLTETEYQATEEAYQKVLAALHEAESVVSDSEQQLASLNEMVSRMAGRLAEAGVAIERAVGQIAETRGHGFKTTHPEELLASARQSLAQAHDCYNKRQVGQALERLKGAEEGASQAARAAQDIPRLRREAEAATAALEARIEHVKAAILAGRDTFDVISVAYAESSWQSVRGNGTEATNRVNWSLESLEEAKDCIREENQEWQEALQEVSEANGWLDEAQSFMRSIGALEAHLVAAKRDAPQEIGAAEADIAKAWQFIHVHDEDIREALEDDLRRAEGTLAEGKVELSKDMPDYPQVLQRAKEANAAADRVLAEAREEHEAAERMRSRALSVLRDARAAVSKVNEYMEDHRRHVSDRAKEYLRSAQEHLSRAEAATDMSVRISHGESAEADAERAYNRARSDVQLASQPRPGTATSTGGSRRSGGSGSSSRSSSVRTSSPSRASSGLGRGGSTSWGTRGRGGGGSTGW